MEYKIVNAEIMNIGLMHNSHYLPATPQNKELLKYFKMEGESYFFAESEQLSLVVYTLEIFFGKKKLIAHITNEDHMAIMRSLFSDIKDPYIQRDLFWEDNIYVGPSFVENLHVFHKNAILPEGTNCTYLQTDVCCDITDVIVTKRALGPFRDKKDAIREFLFNVEIGDIPRILDIVEVTDFIKILENRLSA